MPGKGHFITYRRRDPWAGVPDRREVARSMNLFKFIKVVREHGERIDLLVTLPGGQEKEACLPKKEIVLFNSLHEVEIPEWLCQKEGLI